MKASSFIAGIGVGAAVALLFAPRSGDETREILSGKVEEGKRYVKEGAQELRDRVSETAERGKKIVARTAKAVAASAGAVQDELQTNG